RLEGLFDHANLLRGRPASTTLNRRDDLNAIGRIGHRHGLVVCLTLAKWETVSGQFGGYLTGDIAAGDPAKKGLRRAARLDGALSWPALFSRRGHSPACPRPRRPKEGEERRGRRPRPAAGVDRYATYRLGGMRDPPSTHEAVMNKCFAQSNKSSGRAETTKGATNRVPLCRIF